MIKKLLISLFLLAGIKYGNAQAPNFAWAFNIGGNAGDYPTSMLTDSAGNIYTLGSFSDTIDLDPSSTNTLTFISSGTSDIFLQKVDNNGDLLWAKQMGSTGYESASSLAIDQFENIYIIGNFTDTIDFDPGAGVFILTGPALFIQKLNSNGDFIWATKITGSGIGPHFIKIDSQNGIYITGSFGGTVDFDPGVPVFNLTAGGTSDVFIVKLDSVGVFEWARKIGSSGSFIESGNSIAIDSQGNVFLIGTLDDNSEGNFIVMQKIGSGGSLYWTKQIGLQNVHSYFQGNSIITDADGNVYATGCFGTPGGFRADFDPGIDTFFLSANGAVDIFVLKLTNDGDFIWAKKMGAVNGDVGRSIAMDAMQNIYVTGSFEETVDFDPGIDIFYLTSNGYSDCFVEKLDSSGNFLWAIKMGSSSSGYGDAGISVLTDRVGNVFTTGKFNYTVDFDPGTNIFSLESHGGSDVFLQKLSILSGTSESGNSAYFSVFPNPTSTFFTIRITNQLQKAYLEICNLIGEKVVNSHPDSYQDVIGKKEMTINACNLKPGLYFIYLQCEQGSMVQKLIVQ